MYNRNAKKYEEFSFNYLFCYSPPHKNIDDDNNDKKGKSCNARFTFYVAYLFLWNWLIDLRGFVQPFSQLNTTVASATKGGLSYVCHLWAKKEIWLLAQFSQNVHCINANSTPYVYICLRADTINPLGMRAMCCYWFINNCLINYSIKYRCAHIRSKKALFFQLCRLIAITLYSFLLYTRILLNKESPHCLYSLWEYI